MWRFSGVNFKSSVTAVCGLALLALVLTGCITTQRLATLGGEASAQIKDGRVVFGKISVIKPGGPVTWKGFSCADTITFDCPDTFRVYVFPKNSDEASQQLLSGDGSFYWILKPGEYTMVGYKFEDWYKGYRPRHYSGRIMGKFVVSGDKPSTYLGTIGIFLGGERYGVTVKDEFDIARLRLGGQKGAPAGEPHKGLMVIEGLPKNEGIAVNICGIGWGLDCTKENRGVSPVTPKVFRHDFLVAASRNPTLKWKPATDPDVTYDVVVYEAVALDQMSHGYLWVAGPIIEYETGIKTAHYNLKNKLKANTKYYWSVRMRKDGTVTNWSTISYSYFAFLLVAAVSGSGSGVLFNFSTP